MVRLAAAVAMFILLAGCNRSSGVEGRGRWAKSFEATKISHLVLDGDGQQFLTGGLSGSADFGGGELKTAGGWDFLLAKLDAEGKQVWSKRYGDGDEQWGTSLAVDSRGHLFVVGTADKTLDLGNGVPPLGLGMENAFLASFEAATGNARWALGIDMGGGAFTDVAVDAADGGVVVSGWASKPIDLGGGALPGSGDRDVVVAKFNADGKHLWSRRFRTRYDQTAQRLAADPSGGVVMAGVYSYTIGFGGAELPASETARAFLVKLDRDGNHVWSQGFAAGDGLELGALAVDAAGNTVLVGAAGGGGALELGNQKLKVQGLEDAFVVKLDPAGKPLWSRLYGAPNRADTKGTTAAVDRAGNIWMGGYFSGQVTFGATALTSENRSKDAFLTKLDGQTGNPVWARRSGDGSDQGIEQIAMSPRQDTLGIGGQFMGRIDFGGGASGLRNEKNVALNTFLVSLSLK
jgi:hypothetical protein